MRKIHVALGALLLAGTVPGIAQAASFTADAVQTKPGQGMRYGKLFVSDTATRFEFQQRGRPVIQIIDKKAGVTRLLFPLSKTYLEFKGDADAGIADIVNLSTPCPKPLPGKDAPKMSCTKTGDESRGAFRLEKWKVTYEKSPQSGMIWWDPERKMALRQEMPGGNVIQMNYLGEVPYSKTRNVENWEVLFMTPFGRYQRGMMMYDKEIKLPVMQNFPDGTMRELRNLEVGEQAADLFKVPADYKKIEPPKPVSMAPPPPPPWAEPPAPVNPAPGDGVQPAK